MTTIRWRLSSAGLPDRWEFQPSLHWPLAEEWQIRFKRGQEIEEIGNKIYVGLIVVFFLIKGSLTKQLDGVQTVEDLYRIPLVVRGHATGPGTFTSWSMKQRRSGSPILFCRVIWPRSFAKLKHRDFCMQRAGLSVLRKLAKR